MGKPYVEKAIARLKEYEPPEGYYLAFSGGKDSCCIKALADMAGVKYDAHYNVVGIDPPDLVYFIRKYHPDVIPEKKQLTFFQALLHEKWPPSRRARYCCRLLKEGGGAGRVVVTGVRWSESARRAKRGLFEFCGQDSSKHYLHPIIDWTDAEVWEFLHDYNIPHCSLYDEGWERIGCLFCPMARKSKSLHLKKYPRFAATFARMFQKVIGIRKGEGKKCTFDSGQELFRWYISDVSVSQFEADQAQLSIWDEEEQ